MIYFIGDVHGELEQLAHKLAVRKIKDSQLIQVGDFGLGLFESKEKEEINLMTLDKTLKAGNNLLYVIRGNHDDPSYFEKWQKIGNIYVVPDYSVLLLGGYTVLLIGGAISIDRTTRTEGKDYWKDEAFLFDEVKLKAAIREVQNIDIVVTHNAPSEFWPYEINGLVKTYAIQDINLISDLTKERQMHSELLKHVTGNFAPTHWYYGHFHTITDGQYSNLKYYVLGESEIREHLRDEI